MPNGSHRRSKIIYIDVYLPNINRKYKECGIESLSKEERVILSMFIANESEGKILGKGDREAMEFIKMLKRLKRNGTNIRKLTRNDDVVIASREYGEEIGEERGREENQIETAKSMLKEGLPFDVIQRCTKLSLEKISHISTLL